MKEKQDKKKPVEEKKRSGSYDKAVAEYEKGMKLVHKRAFADAKAHFEGVLEKYPGELEICERASIYLRIIEEQVSPKKPRPKSADDHYLLGVLEHNGGEYKSAIAQFEKALEMVPGDDRYLYALAASYARSGMDREAIKTLRDALSKNKDVRHMASRDEDFDSLESSDEFMALIQRETAGSASAGS